MGFAIPGTVTKKTKKKKNLYSDVPDVNPFDQLHESETIQKDSTSDSAKDSERFETTDNTATDSNIESNSPETPSGKGNDGKKTTKNKPKVKRKVRVKMH